MKILFKSKDGGSDSNVTGYWLIESKTFFSIVLLCFDKGSREAFHNHAFNAISWILYGKLNECVRYGDQDYTDIILNPSLKPIYTSKDRMHKVTGLAEKTWALSFRGPWEKYWKEYFLDTKEEVTLTNGRKIVQ